MTAVEDLVGYFSDIEAQLFLFLGELGVEIAEGGQDRLGGNALLSLVLNDF